MNRAQNNSKSILYYSDIIYNESNETIQVSISNDNTSNISSNNINNDNMYFNLNNFYNSLKCISCSNIVNLKMCKYCLKFICENCIKKLSNNICKNCNRNTEFFKLNYIDNIIKYTYNSIQNDINVKNLRKKNKNLIKNIEETIFKKCSKHNEKILLFCFNCHKRLCGKCVAFFNEESKIHKNHNIKDYSLLEKLGYNIIIDNLEYNDNLKDEIENFKKRLILKKEENKKRINNLEKLFNYIKSKIKTYYEQKNEIIESIISKFNDLKINIEKKCNRIYNELLEIKSLESSNNNFNISETKNKLNKLSQNFYNLKIKSEKNINLKTFIDFKSFNFPFSINNKDMTKNNIFEINNPFKFNFKAQMEKDNFYITTPFIVYVSDELKKNFKKKYILFPFLQMNGKFYLDFKLIKINREEKNKEKKNNIIDSNIIKAEEIEDDNSSIISSSEINDNVSYDNNYDENKNIINLNNDDNCYEYKLEINLNNNCKETNKFDLVFNSYCLY